MPRAPLSIRYATVLTFVLAVAVAACDSPVAPASLEGPPDALEFSTSSFEGGFGTSMRLEGDEIIVMQLSWDGPPADTTRVVPTAEAWRAFWDAADAAGIHRWRPRYVAEDIVDGAGWSLTIRAGGLEVDSHGINAYPDSRGVGHVGDWTEAFRLFREALAHLSDDGSLD